MNSTPKDYYITTTHKRTAYGNDVPRFVIRAGSLPPGKPSPFLPVVLEKEMWVVL